MSSDRIRLLEPSFARKASLSVSSNAVEQTVLMCASALFKGLTERECMEIASRARTRTFARNELLYTQGQPVNALIFLQSGIVKHTQLSSNGSEVLLWMSGIGDALTIQAGPTLCNHTCSARAMEQCKALLWEYDQLQAVLSEFSKVGENISRIVSVRLRELEERFREVATEKVAKRLAYTLLRLSKTIGKQANPGVQIFLTREELAQMTGTTLFTISRTLSKWAEKGLITPKRESVVITDLKRFESVSDDEE